VIYYNEMNHVVTGVGATEFYMTKMFPLYWD